MVAIRSKILNKKSIVILLIIIIIAASAGTYYYKEKNKPVTQGSAITVGRGDITATVSATGTISAVNTVDISSRITGLVTKVNVNENDVVREGQILIELEDTALRSQLAQNQAQLTNAAENYERSKALAAIGAIAIQKLDADRTSYQVAKSSYDQAVSQLSYTIITSPIDGLVIGKPTPAGQTVAPGIANPMVLMTVVDMSKMQIQVQVDESDIGKVRVGQAVTFTVDAYQGKIFTGTVHLISQKAVIQQNVVYYTVYVDVDSAEGLLFPSMTARVTVKVGESHNALIVPLSTVKDNKGQKYVQIMAGDSQENRTVEIGLSDDEKVEIISGLSEGEQIYLPARKNTSSSGNFMGGGGRP